MILIRLLQLTAIKAVFFMGWKDSTYTQMLGILSTANILLTIIIRIKKKALPVY